MKCRNLLTGGLRWLNKGGERMGKGICLLLTGVLLFGSVCVCYAEEGLTSERNSPADGRATNYFSVTISPLSRIVAAERMSLEAGDTVRIRANFSPISANIAVGLIDSDGIFHYLTVTGGSVDVTIGIEERGEYRLAVKNYSVYALTISGYVYY